MPTENAVKIALEALKNRDFTAARAAAAGFDMAEADILAFQVKGLAELGMEDWWAAMATFAAATARFPGQALFWLNKGIAEENLGLKDEAVASYEKCLALDPAQGDACGNLSNLYRKRRKFAEAEAMARRALDLGAAKSAALNALGLALGRQGKFAEAEKTFAEAAQAAPGDPDIVANQANLAVDQLQLEKAWPLFAAARAIENKPVFRYHEGMARLLAGDYARGWELYEARLELPQALRIKPDCPRWQGEDLTGKKLLIVAEQGLGDAIQFCRYGAFLKDAVLIWAVPAPLVRLLSRQLRGTVLDENAPLPVCDFYAPIMSLPFLTKRFVPETASPYLKASNAPRLPEGKHRRKIGLVWAGSPTHERDHERSMKLETLALLVKKIEADFYAPFKNPALAQIGNLPITRVDHLARDFADMAALIAHLDCLITVDTAAAHLAGALGIKTYALLSWCPDWRWGADGKTAWYESVETLRQPRYGDWNGLVGELLHKLHSK
ncbi:MAG: tetratricopeptide repeat protein [Alphaproteobacteria bacterium]|nr:tetratricopeptide repeat protein [Alphaproteobacteria bacterium]